LAPQDSITWIFGDNTQSHDINATHTYANYGTYNVCLIVKKVTSNTSSPCVKYICKTITITQPCNLVVDFNWNTAATNYLTYEFHNLSTPLASTDSIYWNFGDGTTSTLLNPVHTYFQAGTYIVCLRIKKVTVPGSPTCVRDICKTIVIPPPCNLVVDFAWNATSTGAVVFTNQSAPLASTDSITWTFGDGTTSHDVNPTHTYTAPGTYTVCLKVKKVQSVAGTECVRQICKTISVTIPCTLVVDFSWTVSTANPFTHVFQNLSAPLASTDSITWTFGDGTSSHDVNPTHTYANYGSYNVCLIIKKNNSGTTAPCVREKCKTITFYQPCNLVVDFSWVVATGANPYTLVFNNLSTPLASTDTITWTFGDGTSSHDLNPTHTYTTAGTYTVCLKIKKAQNSTAAPCERYVCKTITIPAPCDLVVNFAWNVTSSNPLAVVFTNQSAPLSSTDSIKWTFGDGTSSMDVNPTHTYAQAGSYQVCLIIKKNNNSGTQCVRYICKTVVIQNPCTLAANFTWQPSTANALGIYFTNTSTGAANTDSVRWTFGDGTTASTYNAYHVYAQAGSYNVCLRMQKRNANGAVLNCISEKCYTVTITSPCNLQANFTWHPDSPNVKKIIFTNTSTPATISGGATWSFGDGTTANTWNAVHEYAQAGRYYVCLRVELGPNCVRYKCDSITVSNPPPPCSVQSYFSVMASAGNAQTFLFTPAFQSNNLTYQWTFGDGTGSNVMISTHHYNQAGTYTACLSVWSGPNCASTTCKTVTVTAQVNCDSIHVGYTYQIDPYLSNKVYFYANANFAILDQTWTITKMPASTPPSQVILHTNNPVYVFGDTGLYRVCLRAVTLGGCIKEYCNYVHISALPLQCSIAAYPNPAQSVVNFNVALTTAQMINVYVYNNLNVLVKEKHQQGVTGSNVVNLSIGDLLAGHYTVKIIYGNQNCNSAFQKL
jgi:PKD repeat protein